MKFIINATLKTYNTFKINVNSKYFIKINYIKELKDLLKNKKLKQSPKLVIGEGSNILFTKNFQGIIIKIQIKKIIKIKENNKYTIVKISSGVLWVDLVEWSIENNLYGIENLSYIPGTVGAAVIQNIGAYGVEIRDVLISIEAYNIINGKCYVFLKKQCKLHYRESIFKKKLKNKYIITFITIILKKKKYINILYEDLRQKLKNIPIEKIDNFLLKKTIQKIRKNKIPHPNILGNAGSFFKNPIIKKKLFKYINLKYPEIQGFYIKKKHIKILTSQLFKIIKIKKVKNVGLYQKNKSIIVNYGNATGEQIYNFSEYIIKIIKKTFGIYLEREVNIY